MGERWVNMAHRDAHKHGRPPGGAQIESTSVAPLRPPLVDATLTEHALGETLGGLDLDLDCLEGGKGNVGDELRGGGPREEDKGLVLLGGLHVDKGPGMERSGRWGCERPEAGKKPSPTELVAFVPARLSSTDPVVACI